MRRPTRIDGYAPIEDYAAIGDGRSVGLVALDGSIDWLCLPAVDAPPVLSGLLDVNRGGSFFLRPKGPYLVGRRYVDDSNLLETVFSATDGTVKVTEALNMDGGAQLPWTELVRRVECIEGEVELEWRLAARPRWGACEVTTEIRHDVALARWDDDAIAVLSYDAGKPKRDGDELHGSFTIQQNAVALLAALYFDDQPWAAVPRAELEERLDRTRHYWQTYTREVPYDGPWQKNVRRSVLAQRVLTYEPTGAIAAAATTSLPEKLGGDRNWDYRFSWIRDTALALESLLAVRLTVECHRSFAWVGHAIARTMPDLQPMYALDGSPDLPREDIDFEGWRGTRPVRVGNDAQYQLQLGGYNDVIDAAYRYCGAGHQLDDKTATRCAELADEISKRWRDDDAGIWEIDPRPYTQSKVAAWSALHHAVALADEGKLPDDRAKRWKSSRDEIEEWVEAKGWSDAKGAYVFYPGSDELDASILLAARMGYAERHEERFASTIDAIRGELSAGPFLYRTTSLKGQEGCFLACSFWLVDALARGDRLDEARELMEQLLAAENDVGLYSEEIDPGDRSFLGNFPQALTHLSLILAAVSVMRAERRAV
ncbi:MAG TPA: glycoside hydrolase family 15 protein [Gaiellaceae bacterium]|nr:glycoside hydrolase family 15 protein [Gaiellaceae bacterium]